MELRFRPLGGRTPRTTVEITRDDFVNAAVPDEATSADEPTGTKVTIFNPSPKAYALLDTDAVISKLAELLALHLRRYPQITVLVDGRPVDPNSAIEHESSYPIEVADFPGRTIELDVIEWKRKGVI